jgi:hypothetical protein
MFEQSVLLKPASGRPHAVALVMIAQIAALMTIVAVSLFRIPELTPPKLPVILRYVRSIPLVAAVRAAPSSPVFNHSTTMPR